MASQFKNFGEAAKLYAENYAVVEEMWNRFKADIAMFYDAIKSRIDKILGPLRLDVEITDAYRSWWLVDAESGDQDVPYLASPRWVRCLRWRSTIDSRSSISVSASILLRLQKRRKALSRGNHLRRS